MKFIYCVIGFIVYLYTIEITTKKIEIMTTYISLFDKKATLAHNKKEASKKLGIAAYKVLISDVHISMLKDYCKI